MNIQILYVITGSGKVSQKVNITCWMGVSFNVAQGKDESVTQRDVQATPTAAIVLCTD